MDEYLAYVHDVPLKDVLQPDPLLRQVLQKYPQRKIISYQRRYGARPKGIIRHGASGLFRGNYRCAFDHPIQ